MVGRGAVTDPGLGHAIRAGLASPAAPGDAEPLAWRDLQPHLQGFWQAVSLRVEPRARAGRLKQWLHFLRRRFPEAAQAYQEVRTLTQCAHIEAWLRTQA